MLRSRMFTTAFRFYAGLAIASLVAAFVVGVTSEVQTPMDRILGPLTLGWKGGVGNHFAYAFFVGLFGVSAGLAGLLVAFRDADPEAEAQVVHTESVPLTRAPAGDNFLPVLGSLGLILGMVGLATHRAGLAWAGLGVLVAVAFVWTLRAWAERATGDDAVNAELYHRFVDPLRTPVVALVCIALVVLGLSRVLLAVSKTGSVVVFAGTATVFFAIAVILVVWPRSARVVTTVVVVVGAIIILVAGIIGAVHGEREVEHHGETQTEGTTTEGALPAGAITVVLPEAPSPA